LLTIVNALKQKTNEFKSGETICRASKKKKFPLVDYLLGICKRKGS